MTVAGKKTRQAETKILGLAYYAQNNGENMTNRTHWLDIIPPIPLARGVPVIWNEFGRKDKGVALSVDTFAWDYEAPKYDTVRVDLDADTGFAHALKLLSPSVGPISRKHDELRQRLVDAYLNKRISSADRLALAQALTEVKRLEASS